MANLSKEKHPLDIEGQKYEHSKYFWWPYGLHAKNLPDNLRGTAVCSSVPFFRIEEIDYQQLLKDCISESIYVYGKPTAGYCLKYGFRYLGLSWADWETIEGDNEFFCKLFWSVYLHVNNYTYRTRFDEFFKHEDSHFKLINEVFCDIMDKYDLAEPNAWFSSGIDYLPCILEKYQIYPADNIDNVGIFRAHKYCKHNKDQLLKSKKCGCFFCLKIFDPKEIEYWLDEGPGTALCPYCNIDSVIGDASGYPIEPGFMKKMNEYWFSDKKDE